jgi:hypothetical protein
VENGIVIEDEGYNVSIEVKDEENEGKLRMDVMLTDGCDIQVIR